MHKIKPRLHLNINHMTMLCYIEEQVSEETPCHLSYKVLANEVGLSAKIARYFIEKMVRMGVLTRYPAECWDGYRYTLNPETLRKVKDFNWHSPPKDNQGRFLKTRTLASRVMSLLGFKARPKAKNAAAPSNFGTGETLENIGKNGKNSRFLAPPPKEAKRKEKRTKKEKKINKLSACARIYVREGIKGTKIEQFERIATEEFGLSADSVPEHLDRFVDYNLIKRLVIKDWMDLWRLWLTRVRELMERDERRKASRGKKRWFGRAKSAPESSPDASTFGLDEKTTKDMAEASNDIQRRLFEGFGDNVQKMCERLRALLGDSGFCSWMRGVTFAGSWMIAPNRLTMDRLEIIGNSRESVTGILQEFGFEGIRVA